MNPLEIFHDKCKQSYTVSLKHPNTRCQDILKMRGPYLTSWAIPAPNPKPHSHLLGKILWSVLINADHFNFWLIVFLVANLISGMLNIAWFMTLFFILFAICPWVGNIIYRIHDLYKFFWSVIEWNLRYLESFYLYLCWIYFFLSWPWTHKYSFYSNCTLLMCSKETYQVTSIYQL